MISGGSYNVTTPNNSWSASGKCNVSVEQLLMEHMGPRGKDTASAVVLTIVYVLIFLSGSLGNICTCVVIACNSCMQTTTNYYLLSLAISDLLLLFFGLPPELFTIWKAYPWRFGEAFCYLRPTILELTSYASVLTITAFTVERYIAICKSEPLLSQKLAVLSRAVKTIIGIWIVSLVASLPYAVHTRLYHAVTLPSTGQPVADSLVCSIPVEWLEGRMTYMFQISTFLFFLAPVTLIVCMYVLIGVAVKRSPLYRAASADCTHSHTRHALLPQQPRRVVIRMLVAVTVAFIICWAPFHTQRLMVLYVHRWTPEMLAAQSHIFYISGVLYFFSATVNPILYNVISRRYRVAFRRTIFTRCVRTRTGKGRQLRFSSNLQHHMADVPPSPFPSRQGRSTRGYSAPRSSRVALQDLMKKLPSSDDITSRHSAVRRLNSPLCLDMLDCRMVKSETRTASATRNSCTTNPKNVSNGFCTLEFSFTGETSKKTHSPQSASHFRGSSRSAGIGSECPQRSPVDHAPTVYHCEESEAEEPFVHVLDSNYYSECDNSNSRENSKRAFPCVDIKDYPIFHRSTRETLGMVKRLEESVMSPRCKNCLSDSSSLKNGMSNSVEASRVTDDITVLSSQKSCRHTVERTPWDSFRTM